MVAPKVIAHRGYALHYPENTLIAVEAAVEAGARLVEVDIQLSADQVPFLFHDRSLKRLCGQSGGIHNYQAEELNQFRASDFNRFGYKFAQNPLTTLDELVGFLESRPSVHAFIELKRVSLDHFGTVTVVNRVLKALKPVASQCVVISYSLESLRATRNAGWKHIGAVIDHWKDRNQELIRELEPSFLFCDIDGLPKRGKLNLSPSRLVVFEVQNPDIALELASRGVEFVESFAFKELKLGMKKA